jgi:hypothetical protein
VPHYARSVEGRVCSLEVLRSMALLLYAWKVVYEYMDRHADAHIVTSDTDAFLISPWHT